MKVSLILLFGSLLIISCDRKKTKDFQVNILSENSKNSAINYNEHMEMIRDNFKRINSIKNWTVIDSIELEESSEGGQAIFYFSNKKLQKIVAVYYGEARKSIIEYYLSDRKLSFVFRKDFRYNRPIYWDEPNDEKFEFDKSIITETRSYFYKDVLFEQIKSTEDNKEILKDNLEKEQESLKTNYNNLKQLSLIRQI